MRNEGLQSAADLAAAALIEDIPAPLWKREPILRNRILQSPCQGVFWCVGWLVFSQERDVDSLLAGS